MLCVVSLQATERYHDNNAAKTTVSFLLHCLFHTTNKTQQVKPDLGEAAGRCIFSAFYLENIKVESIMLQERLALTEL